MPKIQNSYSKTLAKPTIGKTSSFIYNGPLLRAALLPVGFNNVIADIDEGYFLLNPSTWEESKSLNWVQNSIPGQSDPILQWINSGARTVSFDALVTLDTSSQYQRTANSNPNKKQNFLQNAVAGIAASFSNAPTVAPRTTNKPTIVSNLDISSYLNYYRSLLYPVYDNANSPSILQHSPFLVTLWVGNTFPTTNSGGQVKATKADTLWVVTNIAIKITKQLANLSPMEAIVTFQLLQYTQIPIDNSKVL